MELFNNTTTHLASCSRLPTLLWVKTRAMLPKTSFIIILITTRCLVVTHTHAHLRTRVAQTHWNPHVATYIMHTYQTVILHTARSINKMRRVRVHCTYTNTTHVSMYAVHMHFEWMSENSKILSKRIGGSLNGVRVTINKILNENWMFLTIIFLLPMG